MRFFWSPPCTGSLLNETNSSTVLNTVKRPSRRSNGIAHGPRAGDSGVATHRSLERGLAVLEAVAAAGRPIALAEAARRVGLHRSTAHHMMQALVRVGYLVQDERSRGYELTSKLYELTGRLWSTDQLGEIARPYVEELTRLTGEGSSVATWGDGEVTIAVKQETDGPVRVVQDVAAHRPVYCTAVGKALAAWLPVATVDAALAGVKMERRTPKTITTRAAFHAELRRIRAAGYAIDDEEQFEGLRCIAMPVFCYTGRVIASMCVVGPKHRMTHQKVLAVRAPLAAISTQLTERLGGNAEMALGADT
jgi:DNA-binding IclR family transcriptional regulator